MEKFTTTLYNVMLLAIIAPGMIIAVICITSTDSPDGFDLFLRILPPIIIGAFMLLAAAAPLVAIRTGALVADVSVSMQVFCQNSLAIEAQVGATHLRCYVFLERASTCYAGIIQVSGPGSALTVPAFLVLLERAPSHMRTPKLLPRSMANRPYFEGGSSSKRKPERYLLKIMPHISVQPGDKICVRFDLLPNLFKDGNEYTDYQKITETVRIVIRGNARIENNLPA